MAIRQREEWRAGFTLDKFSLEDGTFTGLASVFGSVVQSWIPTVIQHGAFTKTIQENGNRVKLLWGHDVDKPIGLPTRLEETDEGLFIEGKISQTTIGKDALTLMRDKVVDEMSIGFDPIKWEMVTPPEDQQGNAIRYIKELRLWEVSLVTFAADPLAKIKVVHNMPLGQTGVTLDDLSEVLWEVHRGAVLSAANKKLVKDCLEALNALLKSAEPPEAEEDDQALTADVEHLNLLRHAQLALARLNI
jgi:HK97 family phage prohead protease